EHVSVACSPRRATGKIRPAGREVTCASCIIEIGATLATARAIPVGRRACPSDGTDSAREATRSRYRGYSKRSHAVPVSIGAVQIEPAVNDDVASRQEDNGSLPKLLSSQPDGALRRDRHR